MLKQYNSEKSVIFNGLQTRAKILTEKLNQIEGITCNEVEGAMYAFPRIHFPESYCNFAKKDSMAPDVR